MASVADKPTVGIEIRQLQVRGLTLLFHFDGLKVRFRAQNLSNRPSFISMAGSHFLGQKVRTGKQVSGHKHDLSQNWAEKCDLEDEGVLVLFYG